MKTKKIKNRSKKAIRKNCRRPKIGLALGGGGARGLTHIGVLKTLEKNNIKPDFIAGTSMGAVIGAAYAAGHSPESIEQIAKTTDWREIVNFTVPKSGLIQSFKIEEKLKDLTLNKTFEQLKIPFRAVAVNISKREKVVFHKGDLARAIRASIAIPGVFTPVQIGHNLYVDGGLVDPTPYDVVKDMGADIIIAVDLYQNLKTAQAPNLKSTSFLKEMKKKFVAQELLHLKNYLTPTRFPLFIIKIFNKIFDRILYPQKIIKLLSKQNKLPIFKVLSESNDILINNLAKERLKNASINILITPSFNHLTWTDFDKVNSFIKIGERATKKEIRRLKRLI